MASSFEDAFKNPGKLREKAGKEIETATPESDAILAHIVNEETGPIGPEGIPIQEPERTAPELPEFVRREKEEQQMVDKNIAERHAGEAPPKAPTEEDWIKLEMQMGGKLDLDLSEPSEKAGKSKNPIEADYLRLGSQVRKLGVDPASLPPEVWNEANSKLKLGELLSRELAETADPAKKEELRRKIDRISAKFRVFVGKEIRDHARSHLNQEKVEAQAVDRMRGEGGLAPEVAPPPAKKRRASRAGAGRKGKKGGTLAHPKRETESAASERDRTLEKIDEHLDNLHSIQRDLDQVKKDRAPETERIPAQLEEGGKKIEDKSGGYVEKYSELRMLAKQHHPTGVPEDLAAKIADLDKRYLLNVRTGRDPETQAKLVAELDSLIHEVQLPRPSYETDWLKRPEQEESVEKPIIVEKDATRAEAKGRLAQLIESAKGKLYGAAEKGVESLGNRLLEKLKTRSLELDAQAERQGDMRWVHWMSEQYNKLGWKSKLALGAGIVVGAGVSVATLSVPAAIAFMMAGATQRAFAFSSMFVKYEKAFQDKQWGEEAKRWAAFGSAFVQTAAMSLGMAYAAQEVAHLAQTDWAQDKLHGIAEWMREHNPFGAAGKMPEPMPATAVPPEAMHVAASEAPGPSELPSVEASSGHGYEWMAKRLWEQLSEKHLDPNAFPEGSDVRTLLNADDKSIDSVVHRLALNHHFANADGTSVLVRPDAHLSFDAQGQLSGVPESAATTPAVEAPAADFSEGQVPNAEAEMSAAGMPIDAGAPTIEGTVPPVEAPYPQVDLTQSAAEAVPAPEVPTVESPAPVTPAPAPEAPTHIEAPVPAAPAVETLYTATDHTPINPNVPAIYEAHDPTTGASYLAAYGGTDADRFSFIQDYLAKPEHQGQTIRWAHEVPSITGPSTKVEEIGANKEAGSWLLKFFTQQPKPPSPDAFLRKVSP